MTERMNVTQKQVTLEERLLDAWEQLDRVMPRSIRAMELGLPTGAHSAARTGKQKAKEMEEIVGQLRALPGYVNPNLDAALHLAQAATLNAQVLLGEVTPDQLRSRVQLATGTQARKLGLV